MVTHDPMCPFAEWPEESCYQRDAGVSICALIAKACADEREKIEKKVYAKCYHTKYIGVEPCSHDIIVRYLLGGDD